MHQDPAIFPDPRAFKPERWLDSNGQLSRELEPHMVQFSVRPYRRQFG